MMMMIVITSTQWHAIHLLLVIYSFPNVQLYVVFLSGNISITGFAKFSILDF